MKILFAARGLYPEFTGGSHKYNKSLLERLAQYDTEIDVIHPGKDLHFQKESNIHEFTLSYGRNAFTYSKNIKKFLANRYYDVGYSDGFSLWQHFKKSAFPCIFNHHGFHFLGSYSSVESGRASIFQGIKERAADLLRDRIARNNIKHADHVVSMYPKMTDILINRYKCPKSKLLFSSIGIDSETISIEQHKEKLPRSFLFVGNLIQRKGLSYLINAVNGISDEIRLYIAGEGPLKEQLKRISDPEKVEFLGKLEEIELNDWYQKVEAFVFPGLDEAGPIVILEAMKNGLPVISTDVGIVPDAVDENNGYIIRPGNSDELRKRIQDFLLLSTEQKRSMGEHSQAKVREKFSWDRVADQFYQDLKTIVSKPAK
jgi:glycosyltransferase involved in cell wall biosynthesis